MAKWVGLAIIASFFGCASEPTPQSSNGSEYKLYLPKNDSDDETPAEKPKTHQPMPAAKSSELDVDDVETKLNPGSSFAQPGFHELKFNPCQYGYRTKDCQTQYFIALNFQIVCRDSEGTVENTDYVLMPFARKLMHLKVGKEIQDSQTDGQGYGRMRFLSKSSARDLHFILSSPPNSLGLRAAEVKKIIVPADWCQ